MGPELIIGAAVLVVLALLKRSGGATSSSTPSTYLGASAPTAYGPDTGTAADGGNPLVDQVQDFSGQAPSPGSMPYTPNGSGFGGLDTRF